MLAELGTRAEGLSSAEAAQRLSALGENVLRVHRARPWRVLGRQLRSPILILLFVTAGISVFLGEAANAAIIAVILTTSIGLGFVNEFRAERAADALHVQIRHTVVAVRDGVPAEVDVTDLVPGDVVTLTMGGVVPADMRLLSAHSLSCDEAIITGESFPASSRRRSSSAASGGSPPCSSKSP